MSGDGYTLSFVSGKGGVGKTSIATNLAWVAAKFAKVILVDLDLQNQGATGLFASTFDLPGNGVFNWLCHPEDTTPDDIVPVMPDLHFLPSVPPRALPRYAEISRLIRDPGVEILLSRLLHRLRTELMYEVILLDCHGGLDYLSLASQRQSHRTLVISEADTVTFNGTLELLEFYRAADDDKPEFACDRETDERRIPDRETDLLVNRLSPRYQYDDLNAMYRRMLANHDFGKSVSDQVICYIPSEDFFSESYGDYPFSVGLAQNSVMHAKINLLAIKALPCLFNDPERFPPLSRLGIVRSRIATMFRSSQTHFLYQFCKLMNPSYRTKIEKRTIGRGVRNTQRIIITFALLSTFLSFSMLVTIAMAVRQETLPQISDATGDKFIALVMGSLGVAVFCYTIYTSTGLTAFYKDKLQFEKRLWRAMGKPLTNWQRMSLVKLRILRVGTLAGPFLLLFIGMYYSLILISAFLSNL